MSIPNVLNNVTWLSDPLYNVQNSGPRLGLLFPEKNIFGC